MDDYEDYYFDDTAQGQEGGFGGYGYQSPFGSSYDDWFMR